MKAFELFLLKQIRFQVFDNESPEVVIWNNKGNELYRIPIFIFEKLVARNFYEKESLKESIELAIDEKHWLDKDNSKTNYPHTVSLRLIGRIVMVRCKHLTCLEGIKAYFSTFVCETNCSPEVILDCDWEFAQPALFLPRLTNGVDKILAGVKVSNFETATYDTWALSTPPLPPLEIYPFKDQFVGIHGAIVATSEGKGLLMVGPSGAGKTSCSLELANNLNCTLLADDAVFIHKRTRLVEPFCRPLGIRINNTDEKRIIPVEDGCKRIGKDPILITHCILLNPSRNTKTELKEVSSFYTFKALLSNHQDFCCNLDESIITLLDLSSCVPTAQYNYCTFNDLLEGCKLFLEFTRK